MNKNGYIDLIPECDPKEAIAFVKNNKCLYIGYQNWGVGKIVPKATVKLGYNSKGIALLFEVEEYESLSRYTNCNDPVYKDSCVEFFFTTPGDKNYYNFEFNSLGAVLSQVGSSRENREFCQNSQLSSIYRSCNYSFNKTIQNNAQLFIAEWELGVFLPASLLKERGVVLKSKNQILANFYKCGDDLADPHYLSWNPVVCNNPDFHRPEFFAPLEFV